MKKILAAVMVLGVCCAAGCSSSCGSSCAPCGSVGATYSAPATTATQAAPAVEKPAAAAPAPAANDVEK